MIAYSVNIILRNRTYHEVTVHELDRNKPVKKDLLRDPDLIKLYRILPYIPKYISTDMSTWPKQKELRNVERLPLSGRKLRLWRAVNNISVTDLRFTYFPP